MATTITYTKVDIPAFTNPADVSFRHYAGSVGSRFSPPEDDEFEIESVKVHELKHTTGVNGESTYVRDNEQEIICFLSDSLIGAIEGIISERFYKERAESEARYYAEECEAA
jgi:hypothetical protein